MTAPLDLTFEVTANDDDELTCFACRLSRCELAMRVPGNGNVSWYGLHDRCYPIVKARTPDPNQKLSDARAALRKIADGNPAPVGKWLSDVEMAEIARRALAGTTAPVAVPDEVCWHPVRLERMPPICRDCGITLIDIAAPPPPLPRNELMFPIHWGQLSRDEKKACDGTAPAPVQVAYAECARIARRSHGWEVAESIALEIESAAARARGGK